MLRYSLLLGAGLAVVVTAATAQPRKQTREDLLDALSTHIQICAEIGDNQARLACYDKLQTKVGDVQAPPPSPTPLRPGSPSPPPPAQLGSTSSGGGSMQPTPLNPPPLSVPGGGVATLGGGSQVQS